MPLPLTHHTDELAPRLGPVMIRAAGGHESAAMALSPSADGGLAAVLWLGALNATDSVRELTADLAAWQAPGTALLTEHWRGGGRRPGLRGYRIPTPPGSEAGETGAPVAMPGQDWSPRFTSARLQASRDGSRVRIKARDDRAGLALTTAVEAVAGGALRVRHSVRNVADGCYVVEGLEVVVPVTEKATEILDFTARFGAERHPQRRALADGLTVREGRIGKPAGDSPFVMVLGTPGFGYGHGEVVGMHVAWSGNSVYLAERHGGSTLLGGGELLHPGEVILPPGGSYSSPWVYITASAQGLDGIAQQFHRYLRSLPAHPEGPRLVNFNGWEALGFGIDVGRLHHLADLAAEAGAERYVLDDAWFGARRSDRAGLGDWQVSPEVFPDGLGPLIDRVHGLGMQFGLWFEPEMINEDSDLYREHPDWVLAAGADLPLRERNQLVLDLTRPEAFEHVLTQMHTILLEHRIDYVKWDHNRSLTDAGTGRRSGAAAVHEQTLAFYRLLDQLRTMHPDVEWESCAGGGGRIDLEVLSRTQRVWASDNTDAQSRLLIQHWTGQLVAPEYVGAHVSRPFSEQTGRYMPLRMRAMTALFGSFGIEWNLIEASAQERAELAAWCQLYRQQRNLLHTGDVIRLDGPDDSVIMHGVVSGDRSAGLFCVTWIPDDGSALRSVRLRPRGLRAYDWYRVVELVPRDEAPSLLKADVRGRTLELVGVSIEALRPLEPVLVKFEAVP